MPENEIYKFLKENRLTDKDEASFIKEYSDPKKSQELHKFMVENELTDKDSSVFYETYFSPVKKKVSTPTLSDIGQPFTSGVQTPLVKPSPLASNLKSTSATKPKQVNPFTATKKELEATYGENYNREQNINRQKNYVQGLEKVSKKAEVLIPQYEAQVQELNQLDDELEDLKQDPNAYNQAVQVRNQKVGDIIKLADSLRAEKEKADIYEKGLSAVDILRRANEDTFGNRAQSALNTLGIMSTTMLPTIARGAKLVDSYVQAKVMGFDDQETELYQKAQAEISKNNWKGLTDIAREFYDKNQILEGGFGKASGFEKIQEGDYKAAGTLIAKELVQNLPVTLGIGASFVNPLLGASFVIGGTAGAELQEMDINNPQMSEQAKIANAFIKGGSEYATEKVFGTFNYLGKIAGKTPAAKKMILGTVGEAFNQVAKKMGIGADVIEEVSTEVLNKVVGDYTDYVSGKTSELDFKKGLGETITTALSTSLLMSGAGRAYKYGNKKIDDLRAKAKQLQVTAQDPNIKPEIANAVKEEILNVNQQIGDEAAKAKAIYDALPEESQNTIDQLVEEKTTTEQLLQDPQLPQEIKPSIEDKLNTIQTEIDSEYKSVDKDLIQTEESKLEQIINEPIKETETTTTPNIDNSEVLVPSSEVSAPNNVEVNEPRTIKSNIPTSDKGTQTTEPTIKESEAKVETKEVPPVVEQTKTDVGGVTAPILKEESKIEKKIEKKSVLDSDVDLNGDTKPDWMHIDNEEKVIPISELSERDMPKSMGGMSISDALKNIDNGKQTRSEGAIEVLRNVGGKYLIRDGYHRVANAIKNGVNEIKGVVKNTEAVKSAIRNNKYQKAISEGRMTASDAKKIIESAGLEVPKDIAEQSIKEQSKAEADGSNPELVKAVKELLGAKEAKVETKEVEPTEVEQTTTDVGGVKTPDVSSEVDIETQKRDALVNDLSAYNKLTSAAKKSQRGISALNKIKSKAESLGFTVRENKNKIEVININGKKLVKSKTVEDVVEPTPEARENFKRLLQEGVITPSLVSDVLEPTQIRAAIEAFKKGKETKDVKRLMNELADLQGDTIVKYKDYDPVTKTWVNYAAPLSEIITQEIDVENLSEKELKELDDAFDEMFANIDTETENQLTNYFYEEQETRQQNKSENSSSSKSSETKKPTSSKRDAPEKIVKLVSKVLDAEFTAKGNIINSKVTRNQNRKTALKEVSESLDTKEKVAVEHIVKNLDTIREKLIEAGLIKTDCSWSPK